MGRWQINEVQEALTMKEAISMGHKSEVSLDPESL